MSEFPAHWKVTPFRDLVTLKRGIDLPVQQRKEGEIPIYGSNGIVGFHSKASQDHPGIVTGRSGSIGNVYLHKKPFWALNTTLYSEQTHGNHIEYIYHFLKWFDLSRFSGGTGVPTLNRNDVHDQVIGIPPLPEQKKIAEILSGIDKAILDYPARSATATQAL
jgi:type I restriction enzyme, S subunit